MLVPVHALARPSLRVVAWASLLLLMLVVWWAPGQVSAEDPCLKQVFGRYCLGGDVTPLTQTTPAPLARQTEGKSLALVFPEDVDQLYVMAFDGRIYKVVRSYRVETQLRFDEIYNLLRQKYGPGEDRSRFPEQATTSGRRLASIRRGEGRALHVWHPADTWHIELGWTRELGLSLTYIADAIEAERQAQMARGL
jgi:hypothetical protein